MENIGSRTYCLRENILILPFDNCHDDRFVLTYGTRHWDVSRKIKVIADIITVPRTFEEILDELDNQEDQMTKDEVGVILSDYFYANGWVEDSECKTEAQATVTLWGRFTIIPKEVVKKFIFLKFLFTRPGILISLSLIAAVNVFVILKSGISINIVDKMSLKNIALFISINAAVVIFHEIGHAVALLKYGYFPGRIGGAFYMAKPVMFTDVNSCWRLNRAQRQCVNIGGMYFQLIMSTVIILIAYLAHFGNIIDLVFYSYFSMFANFNVFIKADGYWMLSDYLGVSNLHDFTINVIFRRKKCNCSRIKKAIIYAYTVMFVGMVALIVYIMAVNFYTSAGYLYRFYNRESIRPDKIVYSVIVIILSCIFVVRMTKKFPAFVRKIQNT